MRKFIKKILNLLGWTATLLMLLGVSLSIVINIPSVQDKLTTKGLGKVEELFGNNISYGEVRLRLFNRAEFNELLIKDPNADTLLYASELKASFPGIIRRVLGDNEAPIKLKNIHLKDSYIRIYNDSTRTVNLKFIVNTIRALKKPDKIPEPFYINKVTIEDSRLDIHQYFSNDKVEGLDLTKLTFDEFNLKVKGLKAYTDTVTMKVETLALRDKSGFLLKRYTSDIAINSGQLHFKNVSFQTSQSDMKFGKVYFDFNAFKDFAGGGIIDKVQLNVQCDKALLVVDELKYFAPVFNGMNNKVNLSGLFYGTISNLNGRQLKISYGEDSFLKGSFDINGLPNGNSTFLIFNTDELRTTTTDINSFVLPYGRHINLPDRFAEISYYSYKGNFTGFFKDFVSYGNLETNLGSADVDILFRPHEENISFSGKLKTEAFNVGAITSKPEMFGDIKLNLVIDGQGTVDKGFEMNIEGRIDEFEANNYTYESISVDGNFSEDRFNGNLEISDPNLNMNFNGLLDFSTQPRQYNFTANVFHSNLYKLNFHKYDSNYSASFLVNANLSGNKIDDVNGDVKLLNSLFTKTNAQIQVYDLELKVRNDSLLNEVILTSDFLDGNISGHFKLSHIHREYFQLVNNYLPSIGLVNDSLQLLDQTDFEYSLRFKNSDPLFAYFTPEYNVKPRTIVEGALSRGKQLNTSLHVESPEISVKNTKFYNLILNSTTIDSILQIDLGCSELDLSNRLALSNFTLVSSIDSNYVDFNTRWINWDSTLTKGVISGSLMFGNKPEDKLSALLEFDSSVVVIDDSVWAFAPFTFSFDTNYIAVNDFQLVHNNEQVNIHGRLANNVSDSLYVKFDNFSFANLNFFTRSSTFNFGGILNGDATIKNRDNTLLFSSLFIENLELNEELIGDTYLNTYWDNRKEAIVIDADVLRNKYKTLNVTGEYYPTKNGELDLALNLKKFRLNFINPYLNTVFSDIQGVATGLLAISGTARNPFLNGNLNIQYAALTIDYLQTRYSFDSDIGISNNNFIFENVELQDKYNNKATLNGIIRNEYLRDYSLNLNLQTQNFFSLNTGKEDNKSFFGRAFTTGLIRINGPTSALKFDITATTERGTELNIPLSDTDELEEFDFIKVFNYDTLDVVEEKEEYKVNLSGMQLDFDLNITPDAEVKIIFDPTMGDVISTVGNGDLRVAINSAGEFKMLGEYVIESGTYLFTLKDVLINKKFKVEQGSNLQWTGEPLNANINVDTYYRTKASLADLTGDPNSTHRYSVDCQLGLTGKLLEPEITYNIFLPFAEQEQREQVTAAIQSNEEMGKQFLSLLVLNRFLLADTRDNSGLDNSNIAGVNASELLSNQLSNWLSQISDEVDIGVNYRPGSEISPQELELALSTQLLNDRLSINGSVDMKTNAETDNANEYLGNLDLDYKITKSGKFRARAYNRANDNEIASYGKYTQGVGVFFTEEFDKINEIGALYRRKNKSRKKNKKLKQNNEEGVVRDEEQNITE